MRTALIVLGDTTDHGGEVISAAPAATVGGRPVARIGDLVACPRCGGEFVIVQGNPQMHFDGAAAAYDGCAVACGAKLIASQSGMTTWPGNGDEDNTPRRYFSFDRIQQEADEIQPSVTPPARAELEQAGAALAQGVQLTAVRYDMTRSPPAPIMESAPGAGRRGLLSRWLAQDREPDLDQGRMRRADVVILNDPTLPPTQDNIRQIVAMPASAALSDRKMAAFDKIAGNNNVFATGPAGPSVLTVRATLYFQGSHTPRVREAICRCFDLYEAVARDHLAWLWREESTAGPDKLVYAKAKSMRDMLARMDANDHVGFAYTGAHAASPWLFRVSGLRAWEAAMGDNGLDTLQFSMPGNEVLRHPARFQHLFVECARLLAAQHGHGGYALNVALASHAAREEATTLAGLDAGNAIVIASRHRIGILDHIKTVGWLTAINTRMVAAVGGLPALRSALPRDWFAKYSYGSGIVIQAGPAPETAPVDVDAQPAIYVLPNRLLAPLRVPQLGSGAAAEHWLRRFDVPGDTLLHYKAKLLGEPKLTAASTLPDAL